MVTVLRECVWFVCCYVRKKAFFSVLAITERRNLRLYEVPLCMSLLGFGIANFHMFGIIVKSRFKHAREECESQRVYVV